MTENRTQGFTHPRWSLCVLWYHPSRTFWWRFCPAHSPPISQEPHPVPDTGLAWSQVRMHHPSHWELLMGAGWRTDPCSSNQVGTGHCRRLAGKGGCMSAQPSSARGRTWSWRVGKTDREAHRDREKGETPQAHTETWAACTPAYEPTERQRERSYTDARRQRQRRGAKLVQTLWPRGGHLAAKPSTPSSTLPLTHCTSSLWLRGHQPVSFQ